MTTPQAALVEALTDAHDTLRLMQCLYECDLKASAPEKVEHLRASIDNAAAAIERAKKERDWRAEFGAMQAYAADLEAKIKGGKPGDPFQWLPEALDKAGMAREADGARHCLAALRCERETSAFLKQRISEENAESAFERENRKRYEWLRTHVTEAMRVFMMASWHEDGPGAVDLRIDEARA